MGPRTAVRYPGSVGTWYDPGLGRPIAAPLDRCAVLLGVDLASLRKAAASVEPYICADGTRIWSLMQLERQLGRRCTPDGEAAISTADEHGRSTCNQISVRPAPPGTAVAHATE